MEIRLAHDSEGLEIMELFSNKDLDPMDWGRVFPYWAVAVEGDEIVAAMQIHPGLPFVRFENLLVKKDLTKVKATKAAIGLIKFGEVYARNHLKVTGVIGFVSFQNKPIKRLIQKQFGAEVSQSGSMLVWRI